MFHLRREITFFMLSLLIISIILHIFDTKVKVIEAAGREVSTTFASGQESQRGIIIRNFKGDDYPVVIWSDNDFSGGTVSIAPVTGGSITTLASNQRFSQDLTTFLASGQGSIFDMATGYLKGDNDPVVIWASDHFSGGVVSMAPVFGGNTQILLSKILLPNVGHFINIAVGDFNEDGNLDILVRSTALQKNSVEEYTTIWMLLGNGDGTFQLPHTSTYSLDPFSNLVVGDFNSDGKLDIATGSPDKIVSVLLGNGDGTFQAPHSYRVDQFPEHLVVGDFNSDGKPDIATDNSGELSGTGDFDTISVLLGNGDGTFQPAKTISLPVNTIPSNIAVGDFWGNGKPSIAVGIQGYGSPSHGALLMLRGNGDGTFQSPVKEVIIPNGFILDMAVADFKKNKKLGICWTESTGKVRELISNGDGTFQAPQTLALTSGSTESITVGNFGKAV